MRFSLHDFRPQYLFILLIFAFVGGLPWMAQGFAQPRYISSPDELITKLEARGYDVSEVGSFASQPDAVLTEGRLLYPRMYQRNEGMASANPWPAYAYRDFPRMGFIVMNNISMNAIFITRELQNFPQGADVIMLGCRRDGYVEAHLLVFNKDTFQTAALTDLCK